MVHPFEARGGDGSDALAATLTEEVFLVLDGPERLVVAAEAGGEANIAAQGYALSGSVREMDGEVRITARIVLAETGTQVWTAAYDEPVDALHSAAGQRRIARLIALATEPMGRSSTPSSYVRALTAHGRTPRGACSSTTNIAACSCRRYASASTAELATTSGPRPPRPGRLVLLTTDAWAHGFGGVGGAPRRSAGARTARKTMDINGENPQASRSELAYFSGADFHK